MMKVIVKERIGKKRVVRIVNTKVEPKSETTFNACVHYAKKLNATFPVGNTNTIYWG
jgi:hypothetical protein